jgi:hypothetical protein
LQIPVDAEEIQVENRWKRQSTKIQKNSNSEHIVVNQQSKSNKQQNNKKKFLITYSNKKINYILWKT